MSNEELNCSFCGRAKAQTELLIAGLDAHICDRCIEQAHGIVAEENQNTETATAGFELKTPIAIKPFRRTCYRANRSQKKPLGCCL